MHDIGVLGSLSAMYWCLFEAIEACAAKNKSKTADMLEESLYNLMFIVLEGSCNTPCTTTHLRTMESHADMLKVTAIETESPTGERFRRKFVDDYGRSPELERGLSRSVSSVSSAMDEECTERT